MMAKMCFDMAMCAVRAIFWYVKLWYGNMRSYGNALTFNIAILEHGNVMIWQCALLWQCFDIWYGNTLIWQCEHLRQCALIWQYLDMAMFWYGNVHSYGNATELTGSTATCLLIKVTTPITITTTKLTFSTTITYSTTPSTRPQTKYYYILQRD